MAYDDELEAVTRDLFLFGKATTDIYYKQSMLSKKLLDDKGGIYKTVSGGLYCTVPLVYDVAVGGPFGRNDSLLTVDKQMVDAAHFWMKNYHSTAVMNWVAEMENSGETAFVDLVLAKVQGAQNKIAQDIGQDIYKLSEDQSERLNGLLSICNSDTTRKYGDISEDELVASDGTKPWKGNVTSSSEVVSLQTIQDLRSSAKIGNGNMDKPDWIFTTESIFNKVSRLLQAQQRFVSSDDPSALGFKSLVVDGAGMIVDDYCPSGHMFAVNTEHLGFAVQVPFKREEWQKSYAPPSRYMFIIFRGNLICNHRKAHAVHTALTIS